MKLTKAQKASLTTLSAQFQAAKDELVTGLQNIRDEWQEAFDQKSEKWQESDAGTKVSEKVSALEEMIGELDGIELPDLDSLE